MTLNPSPRLRPARRHLLALIREERRLAERLASLRTIGRRADHLAAACGSLHWACEQLAALFPEQAAAAREDFERLEVQRARTGPGAVSAPQAAGGSGHGAA